MYTCMNAFIYMYVYVHIHVYICVYIHMYAALALLPHLYMGALQGALRDMEGYMGKCKCCCVLITNLSDLSLHPDLKYV